MIWLQNLIVIVAGFLISRIFVEEGLHFKLIDGITTEGRANRGKLISVILFPAYWLSLFFPNTVVVIALLPVIKEIRKGIKSVNVVDSVTTDLILALIYGANIGGMGSMTGASSNIFFLGYIEMYGVVGKEAITFFSWILPGVPITLLLLMFSRYIICPGKMGEPVLLKRKSPQKRNVGDKRLIRIIFTNFILLFVLTGFQYSFKPEPLIGPFNWIDVSLIIYLTVLLFFSVLWPKGTSFLPGIGKNLYQLMFFGIFVLPVFIGELLKDVGERFRLRRFRGTGLRSLNRKAFTFGWQYLFDKKVPNPRTGSKTSFISIGRMLHDLPFTGIFFMGAVILLVMLALRIGDDPSTPDIDGYIFKGINYFSNMMIEDRGAAISTLLIVMLLSVFLTEFISNTTVIIILFAIAESIIAQQSLIFFLIAITVGSTAAFMSPLASPVNALAFGGIRGVSLKRMILKGFILNIISILVLAGGIKLLMVL